MSTTAPTGMAAEATNRRLARTINLGLDLGAGGVRLDHEHR